MSKEQSKEQGKAVTVIGQICSAIDLMHDGLSESLQDTGINPRRFIATAKMAVQTHPDRRRLENADRQSLYLAVKKAAGEGLMPDGREAALVVYRNNVGTREKPEYKDVVNYQPMTQGLIKLARNSGEIDDVDGFIVYEHDKFAFKAGRDKMPEHEGDWFGDRGQPIGVWAFVKMKNGEVKITMLSRDRVNRLATYSKLAKNYDPKEGKSWEEWWKKAAIRNVLKYAPRSTALENALRDEEEEFDFNQENVYHPEPPPVNPVTETPKTETKAASIVKAKAAAKKKPEPEPEEPPHDEETGEVIEGEVVDHAAEEEVYGEEETPV